MKSNIKIQFGLVVLMFGILFSLRADAATLDLALSKDITSTKDDVVVLVSINSENKDINTAQATISFPANLLEVSSISKANSLFTFWLEEPTFDNGNGTIRFVGGSLSGLNGSGLKILQVSFKVKGSGTGRLKVNDAAITASDGSGSNVYNTANGLDINIPSTADFQAVKVERANQAITLAKQLPAMPKLDVPFYPDPTKWNNRSAGFQAKWSIGSDIIKAGISLDNKPVYDPAESSDALLGSKTFAALSDGVYYLHLRYSNNIGWGPTLHYRLALDTTPPSSFKIIATNGLKTIESTPSINFASSDITSGINNYVIHLDNAIIATTTNGAYKFDPLFPGVHQLVVSAFDKAGNSTSQTEKLEIIPIESPVISYVSRQLIVDQGQITAGGTSANNGEIILQIQNSQKQNISEQVIPVDNNGNWNITIDKPLSEGSYNLIARARNAQMQSSLPVVSDSITVKQKPMLVIGSLEVSQTWFFISLIIILLGSFGAGWQSNYRWKGQLERRVIIAQRDVINILESIKSDINKLLKNYTDGHLSHSDATEMEKVLKNMKSKLDKSNDYIVDNIKEINK